MKNILFIKTKKIFLKRNLILLLCMILQKLIIGQMLPDFSEIYKKNNIFEYKVITESLTVGKMQSTEICKLNSEGKMIEWTHLYKEQKSITYITYNSFGKENSKTYVDNILIQEIKYLYNSKNQLIEEHYFDYIKNKDWVQKYKYNANGFKESMEQDYFFQKYIYSSNGLISQIKDMDYENKLKTKNTLYCTYDNNNYPATAKLVYESSPDMNSEYIYKYELNELNLPIKETTIHSATNTPGIKKWEYQIIDNFELIKKSVQNYIENWQRKGKFEKNEDYQKRVNETSRQKEVAKYTEIVSDSLGKAKFDNKISKNEYDSQNEAYKIYFNNFEPIIIGIPLKEAELFDKNSHKIKIINPKFGISESNKLIIVHLEFKNPINNKIYKYNCKDNKQFASINLQLNFSPIDINKTKTASTSSETQNTIIIGKSDVDINIPQNSNNKKNTYALIIGNEDYSSFQMGLNTESNVDFAMNDAKIFKEYCNKIIGIPEKQIKLLINATSGQMNQGIAWLNNLAKIDEGNAELILYYSGHGLPDEKTKESYLIPVDISGGNVAQAVKLIDIYNKLNEYPSKKVTIFLDACFSGGARNHGLVSMKGVKIKPKENIVTGNMVVFSSSTGEESSNVYKEKQHGFMTYFLLKKLQESKGNINYKDLAVYIIENVKKESALIGKTQTPQLNYSPNIENIWINWLIK